MRDSLGRMPVEVRFEAPSLFLLQASGPVTADEVLRALDTPTTGEVAVLTRRFGMVFARGVRKVALLADAEAVHAVSRMFASFASTVGTEARVFRDELPARQWLLGAGSRH